MTFVSTVVFRRLLALLGCVPVASFLCWAQAPDDKLKREVPVEVAAAHTGAAALTPASAAQLRHDSFVIGNDDVLAISVWKEAEISRTVTVRTDGKISLPLVGEVQASAKTPKQLEAEISSKLSVYIPEPAVTVIVQEIRSQRFNILGQVAHPGSYVLSNSTTVLDAIAMGGGFRDFAKQKSILVLRGNPDKAQIRFAFNYKEVIKGQHPEQNIKLEPGDTVIVP
jgi:polysaccharide export outer membrane protein